ncbi:hypothetical protein DFA_00049 [Cavenderia fasciculata]|uniref:Neutral ceramidase n=1 Tax=Cavenderia fasciculata TaxID=261658 RepID=F4PXG2_CACFS|nr:uncharacterized protein DFA_00049 [Cavenderia fasciculata]EGG19472.1 hypothetical protein DFA_00049 [Cavenderia fasciculata]|eukprot:XP_004357766.1 hypothetical protein DFA_00049 [Cavenderia fasciculata]
MSITISFICSSPFVLFILIFQQTKVKRMNIKTYTLFIFLLLFIAIQQIESKNEQPIKIDNHQQQQQLLDDSNYELGVGIWDVTGPAAETGMMGYAQPGQITEGIHFRLRARAFVFVDVNGNRAVYVSTDACMIFQAVKLNVVQLLQDHFGPDLYTSDNVLLSGIHTHSGPAGYSMYALYGITALGFYKENFDTICNGIVQSIIMAHNNVQPGRLLVEQSTLYNTSINRSPNAYLNNPEEERSLYQDDTDKNITVIRLENGQGDAIGVISLFSVHCVSMNNTNHLISGDNKGYASYMFEKYMNGNDSLPGVGPFVAAFGQSNEGDVSPNTMGPKCPDGSPCSSDSTCNGKNEGCIAHGPGIDMFDSTKIIGTNQFQKTLDMLESASTLVSGAIQYRHTYLAMTNLTVYPPFVQDPVTTCRPAMGYAFAAGTTDGPGAFDFTQNANDTQGNPFWNFISGFIAKPTQEQRDCQAPKPILLDVGMTKPLPWIPDVVPIQIITIGQIVLCAVPGEFTTMSGRRLRNTITQIIGQGIDNPIVLVAGLANTYTGYIATPEEYDVQRFEGAATAFGPNTLNAYLQEFSKLAQSIVDKKEVSAGPTPRNMTGHTFFFLPPVIVDEAPNGQFGKVLQDVESSYSVGDTVTVSFYGANPRNNFMTQSTFLTVDMLQSDNTTWRTILVDGDWDTRFYWKMHNLVQSAITIEWIIDPSWNYQPGTYRITHSGYAKPSMFSDKLVPYSGQSSEFQITN